MEIMLSIDCTTYNHGKYIAEALDGFLMQKTNFNFEVLVHDDASTDNTAEIVNAYAKKYPNIIKPIIQDENKLSQGIRRISYKFNHIRALGKYIAVCEGDDYWIDRYKLQKQINYMEGHPGCTMCFHSAKIINSKKKQVGLIRPYLSDMVAPIEDLIIGGGGFCPTQSIIYKKEALNNPPDFYFTSPVGDYPLQIITAQKGFAYYIDENMSIYRKVVNKGTSWSSRNKSIDSQIRLNDETIKMLIEFNEFTNNAYKTAVARAIDINKFYKVINQRNFKELIKKEKFKIYINLSLRQKILTIVRILSPMLYSRAVDLKYK